MILPAKGSATYIDISDPGGQLTINKEWHLMLMEQGYL